MRTIAFIFARGGSKGLPGKNIRQLGGKPLIGWSIAHALSVPRIDRVIVSTDSNEIAAVARDCGAEVPFIRPAPLAADASPEWLAWRHALEFVEREEGALPDVMVSVPATAPLRGVEDIERCLDVFAEGDADIVVTMTPAHRSPWFNMVKMQADGTLGLVIPPTGRVTRRQDAPVVYDLATVAYVARPQWVLSHDGVFDGRVRGVEIPVERAVDIDTLHDFRLAEFLLNERDAR